MGSDPMPPIPALAAFSIINSIRPRLGNRARRAVARLHGERIGAVEDDQRLGVAALDLRRKSGGITTPALTRPSSMARITCSSSSTRISTSK